MGSADDGADSAAAGGRIFGYAGRTPGGGTPLGTAIEASADCAVSRRWSINACAGHIRGGDVVRASFAGDRLTFLYVESVVGL